MKSEPYNVKKKAKFLAEAATVSSVLAADDCWPWPRKITDKGYGRANYGKSGMVHKMSLTVFEGRVPAGFVVCHLCNNPSCFNPAHLCIGTDITNAWHKKAKTSTDTTMEELVKYAQSRKRRAKRLAVSSPDLTADEAVAFWSYVDRSSPSGCWIWSKAKPTDYYGSFGWRDYRRAAHIVSFFLEHRRWPSSGMDISHSCRNGLCVNPAHLSELTRIEHSRLAAKMGWLTPGHRGGRSNQKLSDAAIRYLKETVRSNPNITYSSLAASVETLFGIKITPAAIRPILAGQRGKHVVVDGFEPVGRRSAAPADRVTIDVVLKMHRDGLTMKQIGARIGRSGGGIRKILIREGIPLRPRGYRSPVSDGDTA